MRRVVHPGGVITWELAHNAPMPVPPQLAIAYMEPTHLVRPRRAPAAAQPAASQLAVVHLHRRVGQRSLEPTHLVRPTPRVLQAPAEQSPAKVAKVAALREAVAKADAEAGALAVALAVAETAAARDAVALQEAITLREAVKVAVATGDCRLTESPSPPPSPAGPAEALDPDAIALREAMRSPEWLASCSTMAARAAELHTAVAASTEPPAVVAITEPQDSDIEPQEGDERSASEADEVECEYEL